MRRAARTDDNQAEIVSTFRQAGCSVADCSRLGDGFPDLVVARNGVTVLVEIKNGRGKLRKKQEDFRAGWKGRYAVIRTADQAIDLAQRLA